MHWTHVKLFTAALSQVSFNHYFISHSPLFFS